MSFRGGSRGGRGTGANAGFSGGRGGFGGRGGGTLTHICEFEQINLCAIANDLYQDAAVSSKETMVLQQMYLV